MRRLYELAEAGTFKSAAGAVTEAEALQRLAAQAPAGGIARPVPCGRSGLRQREDEGREGGRAIRRKDGGTQRLKDGRSEGRAVGRKDGG